VLVDALKEQSCKVSELFGIIDNLNLEKLALIEEKKGLEAQNVQIKKEQMQLYE
jgi:hypothetical protein